MRLQVDLLQLQGINASRDPFDQLRELPGETG